MQLYQPSITGSLSVSGSVITNGTITATTLVVQTVTSSVSYLTGSTNFGTLSSNTHTFTGSVLITGSLSSNSVITSQRISASLPASSGTTQGTGHRLRLTTEGDATAVIDYGTAGGSGGWIQAANKSDLSTTYPLLLNPNGGNIGIGTTSPSYLLDVNGTLKVSGAAVFLSSIQTQTLNIVAGTSAAFSFSVDQQSTFSFGSLNGKRVAVIRDSTNADNGLQFGYDTTDKTGVIAGAATSTGAGIDFYAYNGSAWGNRMRIPSAGSSTTLGSGGVLKLIASSGTTGTYSELQFYTYNAPSNQPPVSLGLIKTDNGGYENGEFFIATKASNANVAPTERMRISSAGFVGIQTASPTCPLHVLNLQSSGGYPSLGTIGTGTTAYFCNNNTLYGMLFGMLPSGNGWIQVARTDNQATAYNLVLQPLGGSVTVTGALSKGSGSFRIKHPLASKKNTHQLVHSFIEGPQADLIYRGKVKLVAGKATINIDEASTMTEGTFEALCREIQCFTSNETSWDNVRGKVEGNILTIECQNTESTDEISWLVIGERQDEHMMETEWTDKNGKVIVEPLIPVGSETTL